MKFAIYISLFYGFFSFGGVPNTLPKDPCHEAVKGSSKTLSDDFSVLDALFYLNGSIREEYLRQEKGYPQFADDYFGGNMQSAFNTVSSFLTPKEMDELEWHVYQGNSTEFRKERGKLYNLDGSIKKEYRGQKEGYPQFADDHYNGKMQKAFINISSVLTKKEMEELGWQSYQGNSTEFRKERDKLYNPDGSIKAKYVGQEEGYPQFADDHYNRKMQKAFINISSVLTKEEMRELGWQSYQGNSTEFRKERGKLYNPDGSLKKEYIGQEEGYPQFADDYYGGTMKKAFINISSVLTKEEMDQLGWQSYQGTSSEFRDLRSKLYNPDGSLKEEYIGQEEGYPRFADDHFDGRMQKAFANVSAVLTTEERKELGWKVFQGNTRQYNALIEDFLYNYPGGWQGQEGQQRIADQIFRGNRTAIYSNVSVLRDYLFGKDSTQEFRELSWALH